MKLNKLPLNVIGLNRVGLNQIGSPSHRADTSARPYIDPEVLASLVAVCICDGKSNDDPDRAVIKNLVDPDNPFVISNAAYKLNSGYGKYEEDFTTWRISKPGIVSTINVNSIHITRIESSLTETHAFFENVTTTKKFNIKLKISGLTSDMKCTLNNENTVIKEFVNGVNEISVDLVAGWYGFMITSLDGSVIGDCDITIEQIPSHQGAFVTDGKDDLITSTKTVKEMLGGSNEVTVVSMIHQIESYNSNISYTNYIRNDNGWIRNNVTNAGKTGIYGYSCKNNATNINNILGDKNDYATEGSLLGIDSVFSVVGRSDSMYLSKVAYYWTIIAKIALTTDQINQVISYFNLDKHVKPDVYYDVKKQGLSNDTPEADWYLKDFSGNGHDMQLYNFAKKLGSGIGKYEADYSTWIKTEGVISTPISLKITEPTHNYWILHTSNITVPAHKVEISGIPEGGEFRYLGVHILKNGINELPKMEEHPSAIGFSLTRGTTQPNDWVGLSVEQIPDYEGALVSDGIDDYGKVENLPIYKDYTVVAEYSRIRLDSCILSKSKISSVGSFIFNMANTSYSYTAPTDDLAPNDASMQVKYQSKYINQGRNINAGAQPDSDSMWLGVVRDNDARFSSLAVRSILVYPYSLSPLLIERQLKRYKLGTLYPDMVEFRPVISGNIPYNAIEISQGPTTLYNKSINKTGIYLQEGSTVRVYIQPSGIDEVSKITINGVEYTDLPINPNGYYYADFPITKSPQKISYAIDEYIRYEDIVQPYPAIINLKQDGKTITWGDKLKVGSEVTFVNHTNLLPDLYTVSGGVQYNGTSISWNTSIRVEKSMVFVNPHSYKKANEPNCILAPQTLRIPNSSYKILGYIPDLTGKGNHGIINNSTYAGMSGANGYIEPFNDNKWHISSSANKINRTDNKITVVSLKANRGIIYVGTGTYVNEIKVIATGIPVGGELIFHQDTDITIPNNVIVTIGGKISTGSWEFIVNDLTLDWSNLVIEQLGQYEGSFCLDGVDDYITIPTLAHGGKQVLMKVNLQSYDRYLYDQRNNLSQYLAIVSAGKTIAYEYSNKGGKTYIDGILNEHIIDKDLLNITHNITATNANIGVQYAPNIGTSFARGNFAQMALFDFMLFPDVPDEEEIKELNDIVGIENNIEVS